MNNTEQVTSLQDAFDEMARLSRSARHVITKLGANLKLNFERHNMASFSLPAIEPDEPVTSQVSSDISSSGGSQSYDPTLHPNSTALYLGYPNNLDSGVYVDDFPEVYAPASFDDNTFQMSYELFSSQPCRVVLINTYVIQKPETHQASFYTTSGQIAFIIHNPNEDIEDTYLKAYSMMASKQSPQQMQTLLQADMMAVYLEPQNTAARRYSWIVSYGKTNIFKYDNDAISDLSIGYFAPNFRQSYTFRTGLDHIEVPDQFTTRFVLKDQITWAYGAPQPHRNMSFKISDEWHPLEIVTSFRNWTARYHPFGSASSQEVNLGYSWFYTLRPIYYQQDLQATQRPYMKIGNVKLFIPYQGYHQQEGTKYGMWVLYTDFYSFEECSDWINSFDSVQSMLDASEGRYARYSSTGSADSYSYEPIQDIQWEQI